MKKEKEEHKPAEHEGGKGEHEKDKKRLHLHQIRSVHAGDGTVVHHHTYKDHADAHYTHPEREAAATSATPEEAGQHVAEQFGMNQGAGQGGGDDEAAEGEQPGGMMAGGAPQGA